MGRASRGKQRQRAARQQQQGVRPGGAGGTGGTGGTGGAETQPGAQLPVIDEAAALSPQAVEELKRLNGAELHARFARTAERTVERVETTLAAGTRRTHFAGDRDDRPVCVLCAERIKDGIPVTVRHGNIPSATYCHRCWELLRGYEKVVKAKLKKQAEAHGALWTPDQERQQPLRPVAAMPAGHVSRAR